MKTRAMLALATLNFVPKHAWLRQAPPTVIFSQRFNPPVPSGWLSWHMALRLLFYQRYSASKFNVPVPEYHGYTIYILDARADLQTSRWWSWQGERHTGTITWVIAVGGLLLSLSQTPGLPVHTGYSPFYMCLPTSARRSGKGGCHRHLQTVMQGQSGYIRFPRHANLRLMC
jgi:hypothetical protein